eukprot:SAG31_NODE_1963_length_6802_cov_2.758168_5_plen_38_part_00
MYGRIFNIFLALAITAIYVCYTGATAAKNTPLQAFIF